MKPALVFVFLMSVICACQHNKQLTLSISKIPTLTNASIRGMSVIDENTVWISGSEGTVFRTIDGGLNWKDCSIIAELNNDFRSLHAFDSLRAFVIGINNPAVIYRTIDGGDTWLGMDTIQAEGLFFNSLVFSSDSCGLAISDQVDGQFMLMHTQDAGSTWNRVRDLPPSIEAEGNFAASNTCIEYLSTGEAWFATGVKASRVYLTKDNGQKWDVVPTPIICNESADGIYSIDFRDAMHGIAVGGNYKYPERNDSVAVYTNDGGLSWNLSETMPNGFHSCVQYVDVPDLNMAIALGRAGFDYTLDNGQTWERGGNEKYYTLRCIPGQLGAYVAGSDGRVARMDIIME
ncbi:WD40/YVTN/BNR-like repeat-containing protein [Carboxylicivirga sp. N1Y90]|uniref:WD40/YVTN/BNR-like repeat-containing protein n=1 Tax=Carboxylicivirga fragile TaxID=3417571 RepID=UPI003D325EA4|nr:hypothetical protein [Marinilabiliaceae bacterium N1Y90]